MGIERYSYRELQIKTDRYDATPGELSVALHTFPVHTHDGNQVIMQALHHKLPSRETGNNTLPHYAVVTIGGGASGAMESVGMIKRIADTISGVEEDKISSNKFIVTDIVSISHPSGSAREQANIDTEDFSQSAELVVRTLLDPRIGISDCDGLILWGFSAGGPVMIEVARHIQNQGIYNYKLVLAEPVSTSPHPNFASRVLWDTNVDIFRHFNELYKLIPLDQRPLFSGYSKWLEIWSQGVKEILTSMTTPDGSPTFGGLVWEMLYLGQARLNRLARDYGLSKSAGGVMPNGQLFEKDTTRDARQELTGHIILVSSVFAKVVNLLTSHRKISDGLINALWGYWTTERPGDKLRVYKELKQIYPTLDQQQLVILTNELTAKGFIENTYKYIAQSLFPHATIDTLPIFTGLHSGMMRFPNTHELIINILQR